MKKNVMVSGVKIVLKVNGPMSVVWLVWCATLVRF